MLRLILAIFVIFSVVPPLRAEAPLRFGLTAVVVRENIGFYQRWAEYLARQLGRSVQFVQRRSYGEVTELLRRGELDFAWVCGYPFVRAPDAMTLLAVPIFRGASSYRSYVIVHRDSRYTGLDDLGGRIFAFSDPDSNSGYVVPRVLLVTAGRDPERFFARTFFTFSHAESIEAVADRVADAAAVDSYVYDLLRETGSPFAARTRVIHRSEEFGFPPLVSRRDLEPALHRRMAAALMSMQADGEGRELLSVLMLDGFAPAPAGHFDRVRAYAAATAALAATSDPSSFELGFGAHP